MQEKERRYDVVVIGAGVSGCATARELAKTTASVCVVESEDDVCCGTSKANSAIVHAGYDAMPGSLMARLNVEGNSLMYELVHSQEHWLPRRVHKRARHGRAPRALRARCGQWCARPPDC